MEYLLFIKLLTRQSLRKSINLLVDILSAGLPFKLKLSSPLSLRSTIVSVFKVFKVNEIEGVAGVHIMGIEWEEAVRPIAAAAGLLPRPVIEA